MKTGIRKLALILAGAVLLWQAVLPQTAVWAYSEEEKQAAKSWLSGHGYSPDRAGANQAYRDYIAGKIPDPRTGQYYNKGDSGKKEEGREGKKAGTQEEFGPVGSPQSETHVEPQYRDDRLLEDLLSSDAYPESDQLPETSLPKENDVEQGAAEQSSAISVVGELAQRIQNRRQRKVPRYSAESGTDAQKAQVSGSGERAREQDGDSANKMKGTEETEERAAAGEKSGQGEAAPAAGEKPGQSEAAPAAGEKTGQSAAETERGGKNPVPSAEDAKAGQNRPGGGMGAVAGAALLLCAAGGCLWHKKQHRGSLRSKR